MIFVVFNEFEPGNALSMLISTFYINLKALKQIIQALHWFL